MPTAISHVVYCQHFLKKNGLADSDQAYVIGNLMPDIRYLGVLSREITHIDLTDETEAWKRVNQLIPNPTNNLAIKLSQQGFLFHQFLDGWWGGTNEQAGDNWFALTALKLYEDTLLYSKMEDYTQSVKELQKAKTSFHLSGVSQSDVSTWIDRILFFLAKQPTVELQMWQFEITNTLDAAGREKVLKAYQELSQDKKAQVENNFAKFFELQPPQILIT